VPKNNPLHFFLRLLSVRDYSQVELLKKAENQNFEQADIDVAIKYLISNNFLNDDRVARNYIEFYYKSKGKNWIAQKCKTKGITGDCFEKAWLEFNTEAEAENPENHHKYDELKQKVKQKYGIESFNRVEPKTLSKVYNYLIYRGFNAQDIIESWKTR
jgi:regulatory protein